MTGIYGTHGYTPDSLIAFNRIIRSVLDITIQQNCKVNSLKLIEPVQPKSITDMATQATLVERIYRDARLMTIGEGTSEIQRLVIARQVLAME